MAENGSTRVTLLVRLQRDPTNQEAWADFVAHYGPRIYAWCVRWHMQDADAQDATQDVLLRLADKLRTFAYDPKRSFRGWLKTLTRHACSEFWEHQRRPGLGSGDSQMANVLHTVEAREDLIQRLDEAFDRELLEQAMHRVRLRVAPQTWEAFRLTALEELSGAEAAKLIPMQVAQVYVARRRVQKLLQEEIQKLEAPDPD
ncbi:MAG TPA: sigma-70 family RNA polymerase sigma factor [Gemmataceae bacterium]|nr:sigma-70 family RNA polymerase sigma factor [Gemmataceae bacterium]